MIQYYDGKLRVDKKEALKLEMVAINQGFGPLPDCS